jgi:hypothetical protein
MSAVAQCCHWLSRRYSVRALMLSDTKTANVGVAGTAVICAVVARGTLTRLRWKDAEQTIDVICGDEACIRGEMERGAHYLTSLIAVACHQQGDEALSARLKQDATRLQSSAVPAPPDAITFRYGCQPFDLLRAFEDARECDKDLAYLIVATLIRTAVDGYFVLNRIRPTSINGTLDALSFHNAPAAKSVRKVLGCATSDLCRDPSALYEMVKLLIGEERQDNAQVHVAKETANLNAGVTSVSSPPTNRDARRRIAQAARMYRAVQPTDKDVRQV